MASIIPELSAVQSEALQSQIRSLLPSQQGFGTDLLAQNVIVPIIDLTDAAEGSSVGENLQTAWDFSTGHNTVNTTTPTNIISNAGFWKIDFTVNVQAATSAATTQTTVIDIFDGASRKVIWQFNRRKNSSEPSESATLEESFVVFLRAGDILQAKTQGTDFYMNIWYRQIADINGSLVTPLGFNPQ